MKKSELRNIIREELQMINEASDYGVVSFKSVSFDDYMTQSYKSIKKVYESARKVLMTNGFKIVDEGNESHYTMSFTFIFEFDTSQKDSLAKVDKSIKTEKVFLNSRILHNVDINSKGYGSLKIWVD